MLELTVNQLSSILPNNKEIKQWHEAMLKILPKYDITTDKRLAAFLSQTSHESLDYTVLSENLNYSAKGLNTVFPRYFKNANRDATQYARKPEKIANIVYDDANRSSNSKLGNTAPGDGWKYRGRGIIQLTGKNNYIAFAADIGMTLEQAVDYVQTKEGALESAAWFWKERNINAIADTGNVIAVTKLINGGTHGLADRTARYNRAIKILSFNNSLDVDINEEKVEPVIVKNKLPIIKLGSNGEAVSRVQSYLKIPITGIFDQKTHDSLSRWQKYNGLAVDGIAGPNTYKKMNIS